MGESSSSFRQLPNQFPNTTYDQMVCDALGHSGFGAEYTDNVDRVENVEPQDGESAQFFETLNAARRPLYPDCTTFSELSLSVWLMTLKSDYNLPQGCIDMMCDIIKRVTPEGDCVPDTFYKTKKLVRKLGQKSTTFDCCEDGCMLFYKEDSALTECRFLHDLKGMVKNRGRPEGSICQAFLTMESSFFCSFYFETPVPTRLSRVVRNEDIGSHSPNGPSISIFQPIGQPDGSKDARYLDDEEYSATCLYVLLNCDEVVPYLQIYEEGMRFYYPNISEKDIQLSIQEHFVSWFDQYVSNPNNMVQEQQLKDLAWGPSKKVDVWQKFYVNGINKDYNENVAFQEPVLPPTVTMDIDVEPVGPLSDSNVNIEELEGDWSVGVEHGNEDEEEDEEEEEWADDEEELGGIYEDKLEENDEEEWEGSYEDDLDDNDGKGQAKVPPDAASTSAPAPNTVNSPTLQTPPATIPAVQAPSIQNDILSPQSSVGNVQAGTSQSKACEISVVGNEFFPDNQSAFQWPHENTPAVLRVFDHRGSVAMAKELGYYPGIAETFFRTHVTKVAGSTSSSGDYWEKKFEEQVKKIETLEQQLSSQSAYIKETSSRLEQLEAWMKQMQFSSSQQPTTQDTGAGNDEEMTEDSEDSSTAYETGEDDGMGSEEE
ncbi:hypothetical protein Tsubulata_028897 [Turnera subulata]|uniref:DUF4218 domain-containing protein n=1 Tax=Turnera subulata TaxID=218843 RepID=A0A9Q0FAK5_9ROSI|nr:hypothetical protein Tsubulata_028897 [Turnera subulata]